LKRATPDPVRHTALGRRPLAGRCRWSILAAALLLHGSGTMAAEIRVGIGGCTLPDAIRAANDDAVRGSCASGSGADTIRLPAGSVQAPSSALPVIRSALTLRGDGIGATISGSNQRRVLQVDGGGPVLLENLTLVDGEVDGIGARGGAGLLIDDGDVTLRNVTVLRNIVEGSSELQGGGLRAIDSILRIEDSLFEANKAGETFEGTSRGGNIAIVGGQATILRSTIRGYAIEDAAFQYTRSSGARRGGGIWAENTEVEIIDSVVYQHIGAIAADLAAQNSVIEFVNSTIARGEAQQVRIWRDAASEIRLYNSTMYASRQARGFAGDGNLRLVNSLLVGFDIASMCEFEDGIGSVIENVNSLAPDDTCFGPGTATDGLGTQVESPANNGGPTLTARLRTTGFNPAINTGDPATCTEFDQRGVARGAFCDIGAYEADDEADLAAELTLLTPAPHYLGQTLTWRARVSNLGPADIVGARISLSLAGATLQGIDGLADCTDLSCRIERINVGGTATLTLRATKGAQATFDAGLVVNNITDFAIDPDPDNNTDVTNNGGTLSVAADLVLRHTLGTPGPWVIGQTVQFQIDVENNGPNSASSLDIANALVGLDTYAVTGCNQFAAGVCRVNALGAGATRTLGASARITSAAVRSQPFVTAAQYDPKPDNNRDTIRFNTASNSNVSVRIAMQPAPPYYPVQGLQWVIEVSNAGPDPATNVTIDSQLVNAELLAGDATCSSIPCVLPVVNAGSSVVTTWFGEALAPGPFLHRVSVIADQTDPVPANNADEVSGTIQPASDPAADAWLVTPPPHFVGNRLEFGAQVYNGGPNASGPIDVVFETQNLEIEEIQSPSCGGIPCVLSPVEVGINNGETFSITARITAPGTFYLRTSAVSASYDVIPGNSTRIVLGTATVHPANTGLFRDGFE
jgi:hypothetical protein